MEQDTVRPGTSSEEIRKLGIGQEKKRPGSRRLLDPKPYE